MRILLSILLISCSLSCKKVEEESGSLAAAGDEEMQVVMDHTDLKLFVPDSFSTSLLCEGSQGIAGQVLIASDYKSMTLSFNPGQARVANKMCQIKVFGEPSSPGSLQNITTEPAGNLIYISKPAPIMASEGENGQKTGSYTAVFLKTYRALAIVEETTSEAVIVPSEEEPPQEQAEAAPEEEPET